MQGDFQNVKQIVNDVVLAEMKCVEVMCSLLVRENRCLRNPAVDKVISVLSRFSDTPPIEILKELEEFEGQQNTT